MPHPNLAELLAACVARVEVRGNAGKWQGTAFFVAPGKLLTCTHVFQENGVQKGEIWIDFEGKKAKATVVKELPEAFPDIALLEVGITDNPYVPLGADIIPVPGDKIIAYGYPIIPDNPGVVTAETLYLSVQGPAQRQGQGMPHKFIGLNQERIVPGMSGSPMLSERSRKVCGVLKHSRSFETDLGGYGVPINEAFVGIPQLVECVGRADAPLWERAVGEEAIEIYPDPVRMERVQTVRGSRVAEQTAFWGWRPDSERDQSDGVTAYSVIGAADTVSDLKDEIKDLKNILPESLDMDIAMAMGDLGHGFCIIRLQGKLTLKNHGNRQLHVELGTQVEPLSDPKIKDSFEKLVPPEHPWMGTSTQVQVTFGPLGDEDADEGYINAGGELSLPVEAELRVGPLHLQTEIEDKYANEIRYILNDYQRTEIASIISTHALLSCRPGTTLEVGAALTVSNKPNRRVVRLLITSHKYEHEWMKDLPSTAERDIEDLSGFLRRWFAVWRQGYDRMLDELREEYLRRQGKPPRA